MDKYQKHTLGSLMQELIEREPIEAGFKISWTGFWGDKQTVHYRGTNLDHCRRMAIDDAMRAGWTPPKWWQLWRWDDTRIEEVYPEGV
jgi:hypothetical protein